ncbi:transcriptional regulator [Anaerococcus sp. AGMB00486]|uniref:Transcriptional regulator n=1 Tax=Anaerococcus faecalis TaxID=2742993 RepID=A0ABX2NBT2_9FIRM|nr:transcriptional regulator [Anaerococcus faecalis]NVF12176.1 transcriptional regulator [Anaerococcus faecalis]
MKILIVGTDESLNKIKNIIDGIDSIETKEIIIDDTTLIKQDIKALPDDIDGIFATGIGVFYELSRNFSINVPMTYAHRSVVSLSEAFFNYVELGIKFNCPSFDVVEKSLVDDLVEEFELDFERYYVLKNKPKYDEDFYLSNHIRLFKEGKIDCVFTAFGYSYNILKKLEIPVFRLRVTKLDIKNDLTYLINDIKSKEASNKSFIVHNFKGEDNDYNNKLIKDYSILVDGILFKQDEERIIISNKGLLRKYTLNNAKTFLRNHQTDLSLLLSGGDTINQAIKNSQYAKKFIDETYRIIYYDGISLEKYDLMKNKKISASGDINKISENTGILKKHLYNISTFVCNKSDKKIRSSEMAKLLSLTRRSAVRIMDILVEKGYAKDANANSQTSGRPQKCIEILF